MKFVYTSIKVGTVLAGMALYASLPVFFFLLISWMV